MLKYKPDGNRDFEFWVGITHEGEPVWVSDKPEWRWLDDKCVVNVFHVKPVGDGVPIFAMCECQHLGGDHLPGGPCYGAGFGPWKNLQDLPANWKPLLPSHPKPMCKCDCQIFKEREDEA